ncbi:DNA (cytosine-5)-methyltransferase CMT3 isoform X2 [Musa acuminata AAA Group]|uniref:DNA (cytosine-5)-methyltransferase CMT3 isoform X2 n=1 Tax=Musa acuminata AAA Group TaxID=214697 RepID=UPI0031D10841
MAMTTAAEERRSRRSKRAAAADGSVGAAEPSESGSKRKRRATGAAVLAPVLHQSAETGRGEGEEEVCYRAEDDEEEMESKEECAESRKQSPKKRMGHSKKSNNEERPESCFVGNPIPEAEAKKLWPERYQRKRASSNGSAKRADDEPLLRAKCHYREAKVDGVSYKLDDDAYVKINLEVKKKGIPSCDLYYDMSYSLAYSTFANLPENDRAASGSSSTMSSSDPDSPSFREKNVVTLLDLYSGCGAMSTGLCLGANLSGINLQTRWAVDLNQYACQSLKLNHPNTEVRNEKAEDFLALLIEWEKLCEKYHVIGNQVKDEIDSNGLDGEELNDPKVPNDEFEVDKLVGICYGDPSDIGKIGLKFKVRWKGYGPSDDTWEPVEGLSKCEERIKDFVKNGYSKGILPLPGQADVVCGGPPCQGISGFNRFRNKNAPLEDPKNQQMVVFMDIVEFLKPKYVLMENVVDILKFAQGFMGRYALSRLVAMNYQARLGMMVAGCYGLPQFRMRVFLWGACPTKMLPQFPLPTHDVIVRGGAPNEFEQNIVAYNENEHPELERALQLEDALSDLPPVTNYEDRDEIPYGKAAKTEFQQFIRLPRSALMNYSPRVKATDMHQLFDHNPLQLNDDDYQRVCQIPKRKGANFRDLPGVVVGPDNIVEWDPNVERVILPSGKPLVPDYAMSFIKGKSLKPFGRLWWDETVPTVVTRAEPHNQVILHPEQDRVLSVRENARLQGFPDFYKLQGPVKERYIQVGNAVAVPVARALGYALCQALKGQCSAEPLFVLPRKFPAIDRGSSSTPKEPTDGV